MTKTDKKIDLIEKDVEKEVEVEVKVPLVIGVKTLNGSVITFSSSVHEDPKSAARAYAQKCGGVVLD